MITINRLYKKGRCYKFNHCCSVALQKCPQVRGRLFRFFTTTPRKPNSARRKVGKICLTNGKNIIARLPGSGSLPGKHAVILVKGHGFRDTPGVGYTMIRGALECLALFDKKRRRSLYGAKKN
jgi:small subunit ribosomal protein S12